MDYETKMWLSRCIGYSIGLLVAFNAVNIVHWLA